MVKFKVFTRIQVLWIILAGTPHFQPLASQVLENKLDSILEDWQRPNLPGGVIGVMKEGEILYKNAFGVSNLEYETSINTHTLFNIGSLTKQFTALGIIILQEQGLLSFSDTIDRYFPFFPDFSQRITIGHLIHHTSGMRSLHDILALAGWRGDDYRSNDDLLRILTQQQDLNFEPGTRFSYCNSGYVLLAEIIQTVTGMPYKEWMEKSVFHPLGLKATFVVDNYQTVIKNKATSYYHSHDTVYETAQGYWAYTGAGNIYSTVDDLLRWSRNFYQPIQGWSNRFEQMLSLETLTDGAPNSYAFGVFIDHKFERKRIQHAGVVGGYRAFMCIYPEEGLNIIVLANASNAPFGEIADKAAQIVLEAKAAITHTSELKYDDSKPRSTNLRPILIEAYEGIYYSPELETVYRIEQNGAKLNWRQSRYGEMELSHWDGDTFMGSWPVESLRFSRDVRGKINGFYLSNAGVADLWCEKIIVKE